MLWCIFCLFLRGGKSKQTSSCSLIERASDNCNFVHHACINVDSQSTRFSFFLYRTNANIALGINFITY
jgi:hypothetical protein